MSELLPAPARLQVGRPADGFVLRDGDRIAAPARLRAEAARFVHDLDAAGGPVLHVTESVRGAAIRLHLTDDASEFADLPDAVGVRPGGGDAADERYGLEVSAAGVRVWAQAAEGIARGLTTLRQLVGPFGTPAAEVPLSAVRILDAPRFAWRGLSLDVARTFFTVAEVKSVVDLLAAYKLNVLHLHLTDDQGWRLHIGAWPQLTAVGARGAFGDRPGGFYSQDEYREIVRHAAERHVTVVPEIDVPGHCAAVFAAYPELAPAETAGPDAALRFRALDPDNEATWRFLTDVFTEVAALTPGRHLHMGGDEAALGDEAYTRFVTRVRGIVAGLGKQVVGWQESARAGLSAGDIAQHWISGANFDAGSLTELSQLPAGMDLPEDFLESLLPFIQEMFAKAEGDVAKAVADGARVLLSPVSAAYLDQPYRDAGPAAQEALRTRLGMQVYPGNTVESAMDWDPSTCHEALVSDDVIAGVEAAIWCETVADFAELQFLLLPRLAGIAEKAWAPRGSYQWEEYVGRLAAQAPVWRRDGRPFFEAASVPWA